MRTNIENADSYCGTLVHYGSGITTDWNMSKQKIPNGVVRFHHLMSIAKRCFGTKPETLLGTILPEPIDTLINPSRKKKQFMGFYPLNNTKRLLALKLPESRISGIWLDHKKAR